MGSHATIMWSRSGKLAPQCAFHEVRVALAAPMAVAAVQLSCGERQVPFLHVHRPRSVQIQERTSGGLVVSAKRALLACRPVAGELPIVSRALKKDSMAPVRHASSVQAVWSHGGGEEQLPAQSAMLASTRQVEAKTSATPALVPPGAGGQRHARPVHQTTKTLTAAMTV